MKQRNNGRGIFYGVIGVATLVVAIIGATFAYFTASASNNNVITGDMATVKLALSVRQLTSVESVVDDATGIIPMSNGMVEAALIGNGGVACKDDNGNAVCQIYEITLNNDSSAGQFVDGYVALKGGSGVPTDYTSYKAGAKFLDGKIDAKNGNGTTMRWAQAFVTTTTTGEGEEAVTTTTYSTKGKQALGNESSAFVEFNNAIASTSDGKNIANIRTDYYDSSATTNGSGEEVKGVLGEVALIGENKYKVINTNYIRVSDHAWSTTVGDETYARELDVTSALVFNHNVSANTAVKYYIVVWLSETGTNQTAGSGEINVPTSGLNFFTGNVTFISAQGSEVSATFSNYTRVEAVRTETEEQA